MLHIHKFKPTDHTLLKRKMEHAIVKGKNWQTYHDNKSANDNNIWVFFYVKIDVARTFHILASFKSIKSALMFFIPLYNTTYIKL